MEVNLIYTLRDRGIKLYPFAECYPPRTDEKFVLIDNELFIDTDVSVHQQKMAIGYAIFSIDKPSMKEYSYICELLAPKRKVRELIKRGHTIFEISNIFNVFPTVIVHQKIDINK